MRKNWKGAAAVFAAVAVVALSSRRARRRRPRARPARQAPTPAEKGPITVGSQDRRRGRAARPDHPADAEGQRLHGRGQDAHGRHARSCARRCRRADRHLPRVHGATAPLVFHSDVKVDPVGARERDAHVRHGQGAGATNSPIGDRVAAAGAGEQHVGGRVPEGVRRRQQPRQSMRTSRSTSTQGGTFKIAGSQEFFTSAVAFPAFEKAYGFTRQAEPDEVALAHGRHRRDREGRSPGHEGVNAAMAYGTDGTIAR